MKHRPDETENVARIRESHYRRSATWISTRKQGRTSDRMWHLGRLKHSEGVYALLGISFSLWNSDLHQDFDR